MDQVGQTVLNYMIPVGGRVLVAIVIFVVGRRLIGVAGRVFGLALTRQEVGPTLQRYLSSAVTVSLNILLVIAILGYFGFETTSLAALIAGVGVALGAAWGGSSGSRLKTPGVSPGLKASPAAGWARAAGPEF